MKLAIAKTNDELSHLLAPHQKSGGAITFVPTMGALHAGHASLLKHAARQADAVVVASVFVNPTQFAAGEDLSRYPRTLDADLATLEASGAHITFLPDVNTIYPDGAHATIHAGPLGTRWEGEHRPGHFDGVATVVARLFELVQPQTAIFGEKDWQQLAVIRQMVAMQRLNIDIIGAPIVREADGLAMSSRNVYLSAREREIAPKLYEALQGFASFYATTTRHLERSREILTNNEQSLSCAWDDELVQAKEALLQAGFDKIDYLALVDGETLEPIAEPVSGARIIAAAWLGSTRLIDNIGM